MAANWQGMESALKTYFENQDKPNTPASFTEVGNKIATEYKNAISTATDQVGNLVTTASAVMSIGPLFAAEFIALMGGAAPNFGPVVAGVTTANMGLLLAFAIPDPSSTPSGMTIGITNVMTFGGTGSVSKYKKAFEMKGDMTAAKSAERITNALKEHFNGNKTLLSGTVPGTPPIPATKIGSLS